MNSFEKQKLKEANARRKIKQIRNSARMRIPVAPFALKAIAQMMARTAGMICATNEAKILTTTYTMGFNPHTYICDLNLHSFSDTRRCTPKALVVRKPMSIPITM